VRLLNKDKETLTGAEAKFKNNESQKTKPIKICVRVLRIVD
jgi:hypothetical protein